MLPAYGASGPVVINGDQVLAWVLGIIAWVCISSGALVRGNSGRAL